MWTYGIICLVFLAGFIFGGLVFGFRSEEPITVGTLTLNFADPTRDFLSLRFDKDLDEFESQSKVAINIQKITTEEELDGLNNEKRS